MHSHIIEFAHDLAKAFFHGCRTAPQRFLHPVLTTRRTLRTIRLLQARSSSRTIS